MMAPVSTGLGEVYQYYIEGPNVTATDPKIVEAFDLTLHDIYEAVAKNNANAGGNVLERHAERAIVRGLGLIKTVSNIESIIVKES